MDNPNQQVKPLPDTIFLDLDETLIHSIPGGGNNPHRTWLHIGEERYGSVLRPGVHQLLKDIRDANIPVYILSYAVYSYAQTWNDVFNLGFLDKEIFAREHLLELRIDKPPHGIPLMVDNQDHLQPALQVKRSWLATRSGGIVYNWQIKEFNGHPNAKPILFADLKKQMETPSELPLVPFREHSGGGGWGW